jgi:hypothetical protein
MTRRLILLVIIFIGASILWAQLPMDAQVAPFPGQNLKVRLNVNVRFGGDYLLSVSMPKLADISTESPQGVINCGLFVTISKAGDEIYSQHVESMMPGDDNGWAYTQQYVGGHYFHLNHGTYDATISAGNGCPAAAARGASVFFERKYSEHIVSSLLLNLLAWTLIILGVVGLIFFDGKSRSALAALRK